MEALVLGQQGGFSPESVSGKSVFWKEKHFSYNFGLIVNS